jgi:hypothetical protein
MGRFQFRLRTLLVAVLVLSLPLSWLAVRMQKARRQRGVVEAVERLGGYVRYESEFAAVQTTGTTSRPRPSWLRSLLGDDFCENVVHVNFYGTKVKDAGLEHLETLKNLDELDLRNTNVTPKGGEKLQEALPTCQIDYGAL